MSETSNAVEEGGYTLVELLVVLSLAGLIAAAVTGGLQYASLIWNGSERQMSAVRDASVAQQILRATLAAAIPRQKDGFVEFDGAPDRVMFYGEAPPAFYPSGVARVELALTKGGDGTELILSEASSIDPRKSARVVLARDLGEVRFDYLDASEKLPVWLAVWRDRDRLPDAVRLERKREGDWRGWPSFVAHLPIAQDAACSFDPISMTCRRS